MKILIVSEFFPSGKNLKFSGGVETRNFYIAKKLAKKHSITILTSRTNTSQKTRRIFNFKIIHTGPLRSYNPTVGDLIARISFINDAIKIGKSLDIDIVEGTNFISHFIAKQIATKKQIPAVAWYPDVWVGQWVTHVGPLGVFGEILERINLKRGLDSYIAISKTTADKLKGRVNKKIKIIPCGVDIDEFNTASKKRSGTILCISRLAKYKRVKTLILAFALLAKDHKNLHLNIVGTGPEYPKLKDLIGALHLKNKITFFSNLPRKDVVKLLKLSEFFCLPSEVEGFGISVIEALAAQTPYVISNIDVFKEVTKNGQGGLLFDLENPVDLAQKIEKLLKNKNLYRRKVNEGQKLIKSYSWSQIADLTEQVYLKHFSK